MTFLGLDFCGDESSLLTSGDLLDTYTSICVKNGTFDDLYLSSDVHDYGVDSITKDWDSNTILHAQFNGNLIAGNIEYKAEVITKMRLKRRIKGTSEWLTIYEVPINTSADFDFYFVDRFAKKGTYEYCVVPVIGTTEQNYMSEFVDSSFDGIVICDVDNTYQAIADISIPTVSRNRPNNVVTTLENKYPYVVYNGSTNYESGSMTGLFVEIDWGNKKLKTDSIVSYSHDVIRFLMNGRPKVMKTFDGRIWMIDIVGQPSLSVSDHPNKTPVSFEFVEIGSVDSSNDMYNNAFIDVNVERS